jgi:hypothetical protein
LISAPVRVSDAVDWIGFIDCLDVLRLAIHMYTNGSNNIAEDLKKVDNPEWSSWCRDINTMQHRDVRFGLTPIKKLIAGRPVDTFCPITDMGSIYELIGTFLFEIKKTFLKFFRGNSFKRRASSTGDGRAK